MSVKMSLSLLEAVKIGDSVSVRQHLEQGVVYSDELNEVLREVLREGRSQHWDVVKLLLDSGAQVDSWYNAGDSLLDLESKPDILVRGREGGAENWTVWRKLPHSIIEPWIW